MLNKAMIMGRLTADPEHRTTQSGLSMVRFTVAVQRNIADKNTGERQSDFISVIAWRQTADFICRYFTKGKMIIVEGSIQTGSYDDKNTGIKRYTVDIIADQVYFGESAPNGGGGGGYNNNKFQNTPARNDYQQNNYQQNNYQPSNGPQDDYPQDNFQQNNNQQNRYQQPEPPAKNSNEGFSIGDFTDEVDDDDDFPY